MGTAAEVVSSHCLILSDFSESSPTQLSAMELGIQNFGYLFMFLDHHFHFYLFFHLMCLRILLDLDFITLFCFMKKDRNFLCCLSLVVWVSCTHYRRRCKIRAPCCDEVFDCRHCHNEAKVSIYVFVNFFGVLGLSLVVLQKSGAHVFGVSYQFQLF